MPEIRLTRFQKRLLSQVGIGLGVLAVVFFFFVLPKYWQVKRLQAEVADSLADYQRIQNILFTPDHSGDRFKQILARLDEYHMAAPKQELLPDILHKMAGVAKRNNLEVVAFEPKASETFLRPGSQEAFTDDGRVIEENVFVMDLRGTFFSLVSFMRLMEEGPYKILVKKVMIQNPEYPKLEGRATRVLTMKIVLGILTRSESKPKS